MVYTHWPRRSSYTGYASAAWNLNQWSCGVASVYYGNIACANMNGVTVRVSAHPGFYASVLSGRKRPKSHAINYQRPKKWSGNLVAAYSSRLRSGYASSSFINCSSCQFWKVSTESVLRKAEKFSLKAKLTSALHGRMDDTL